MRRRNVSRSVWLLLFILILAACRDDGTPTPETPSGDVTPDSAAQGQATVESLQVVTLETFPVQVQATVSGNLSDGCTTLTALNVQQQGTTFVITPQTAYDSQIACTQALIPYNQTISLDVLGLAAGTYTVTAGGINQTFTLAVDNGTAPQPAGTSLNAAVSSAQPGQAIPFNGQGFPANTEVEVGIGLANVNVAVIDRVTSDGNGQINGQVIIPANAAPGEQWVVAAVLNDATTRSSPITIIAPGTEPPTPEPSDGQQAGDNTNQATNGLFTQTNIYFIVLNDGGQSGPRVGCNDSVVPVAVAIEPTQAVMTAAYNQLLSIKDQNYGQSGFYNALYQSNLTLDGISIIDREAVVRLSGTLVSGGTCDDPRIVAQLAWVALQYSTVDRVTIFVNGQRLTGSYDPAGRG